MSVVSYADAFGYHDSPLRFQSGHFFSRGEGNPNQLKVLGYFPVVGTVIGIGQIASARRSMKEKCDCSFSWGVMTRGTIEALSLGIILFPVDLAVTLVRKNPLSKKRIYSEV